MQGGLSSYLYVIDKSRCLCNGKLVADDEQFGAHDSGKSSKKSSQQSLQSSPVHVKLLGKVKLFSFIFLCLRLRVYSL